MEGKAIDDILAEREKVDKELQVTQTTENRQKTTSIKTDFETQSMQSEQIDNIITTKHSDPKIMKNQAAVNQSTAK